MKRANHLLRLVILGALGFGIGWGIAGALLFTDSFAQWAFFVGGALGGALLGLALGDWKRVATLALMGALGFGIGFYVSMVASMLFGLLPFMLIDPVTGMAGGVALGLALGNWKRVAVLALAGFAGFGIGGAITAALEIQQAAPHAPPLWQNAAFEVIKGLIGGASLGAALGYLEKRKSFEGQRP